MKFFTSTILLATFILVKAQNDSNASQQDQAMVISTDSGMSGTTIANPNDGSMPTIVSSMTNSNINAIPTEIPPSDSGSSTDSVSTTSTSGSHSKKNKTNSSSDSPSDSSSDSSSASPLSTYTPSGDNSTITDINDSSATQDSFKFSYFAMVALIFPTYLNL